MMFGGSGPKTLIALDGIAGNIVNFAGTDMKNAGDNTWKAVKNNCRRLILL